MNETARIWFTYTIPNLIEIYKKMVGQWTPPPAGAPFYSVIFDCNENQWKSYEVDIPTISIGIEFPFPSKDLADKFLEENIEFLNQIKTVKYV